MIRSGSVTPLSMLPPPPRRTRHAVSGAEEPDGAVRCNAACGVRAAAATASTVRAAAATPPGYTT